MSEQEFHKEVQRLLRELPESIEPIRLLAERLLEEHPDSIDGMLTLATLQDVGSEEERETARRLYHEVLRLDRENVAALTGLALMPGTKMTEGVALLQRAAEVADDIDSLKNLGFMQWDAARVNPRDFEDAKETFEKVIDKAREQNDRVVVSTFQRHIRAIARRRPPKATSYFMYTPRYEDKS